MKCRRCGQAFEKTKHNRVYCSRLCQDRDAKERNPRKRRSGTANAVREWKTCPQCGQQFGSHRDRLTYCSRSCAAAALPHPRGHGPRCRRCRGVRGKGSSHQLCADCRSVPMTIVCPMCATQWSRPFGSSARYCSRPCSNRAKNTHPNRRARRAARRARMRAVPTELVTLQSIVDRDAGKCGICHDTVQMAEQVPHPLAATLDHVVPLARGGHHTQANLQLAHFICNSRKRDLILAS